MRESFKEANYENAIVELFQRRLGYRYAYGPEIKRDYHDPLYEDALLAALRRINPELSDESIREAIGKLQNFGTGSLLQKNMLFTDYLQNGVEVRYFQDGQERYVQVDLVDFRQADHNDFAIINQWTVVENEQRRLDVILFVNGLPLVVMELKSPSREETDASDAYRQLRNYMYDIPSLFVYNMICVMSDMAISKAGTITSGEDRYMAWKTTDGSYKDTQFAGFDTFFEGLFEKNRLLDILKNFICFNVDESNTYKILASYHQYFAVKKAITATLRAAQTDGKGGVFWHTQGSGKSLSMVFYVHALQEALESPTVVVITDRNDLDDQLYGQFARCQKFLRQTPQHAESRGHLTQLLADRQANGIFFTTMQKFLESGEALSQRRNIIVMADEAHRSQYGLKEKIIIRKKADGSSEAKTVIGAARIIRNCLPNATWIGFTGTPIESGDHDTRAVFGDYIDVYDMTQAVEDGATRPVYYESRVIRLKLDEATLHLIDDKYDLMAQNSDPAAIEKSKKELGQMETILGAEETIRSLVDDILDHYENHRANLLTGKAMIVAYSRSIAMKIYRQILALRPSWTEKVALVMTHGNQDPEEWRAITGGKAHRNALAKQFKDNESPLKIAIVVDMWLTGFDVPSLATMYIYKPMSGHNLMQAIARVNRVFQDKEGGLVVDYVGIATSLKQAMHDYTDRDQKNYGNPDISKTAYLKFQEKLSVCRDFFHGFDYSRFLFGSDFERGNLILGGANFLLGKEAEMSSQKEREPLQDVYIREVLLLQQALSLCSSLADRQSRFEAAFFEAVRLLLVRLRYDGTRKKYALPEINNQINELLKNSIQSDGVLNLFSDPQSQLSLFDPKFLEEVANMKEKNLAVALLKKLIAGQISIYRKTNLVRAGKFSERIQGVMNRYLNGMLTNEEVIQELLCLAQDMMSADETDKALGLTTEELAFYDALTKPQAIRDFYKNKELIAITKELTELLRKNCTIDWQRKESTKAGMRKLVKRLLKRYRYPLEGMEDATDSVLAQCEQWVDYVMCES